jgi:uncharacterized protein (TIGR02145 family)
VTDIEGNNYGSVVFGNGQEWMTSNLKTKNFNNGDQMSIQYSNDWPLEAVPATYSYLFNPNNDNTYGRLYSWRMIEYYYDKVCPSGWKVPAMYEWLDLIEYLGGKQAAKKLKSTSDWGEIYIANDYDAINDTIFCDSIVALNGTNESLMNIKPFGILGDSDDWYGQGLHAQFLSSTYDSSIGNDESAGAYSMYVGIKAPPTNGGCNGSYYINYNYVCCDPTTGNYINNSDTVFRYVGNEDLFNSYYNYSGSNIFSNLEAGYIRCIRNSGSSSSIEEIQVKPTYKIYPNPANELLMLELNGIDPSFFVVYDNCGREVKRSSLSEKITQIDLTNLKSGCYFIHVENQPMVTKFIKN